MIDWIWVAAISLAVLAVAAVFFRPERAAFGEQGFRATVSHIYDGDTVHIQPQDVKVRLFGVDAPEWNETGAEKPTQRLRELVLDKRVQVIQMDIDRYQRPVVRLLLRDGRDVGGVLIREGVAKEYCRFTRRFHRSGYYGTC